MIRFAILALCAVTLSACSERNVSPAGNIVTIFGDIRTVDRGPSQGTLEPLFFANGIEFDAACVLTFASLDLMDQSIVRVSFPQGGDERRFSGPLLRDVLSVADIQGQQLTFTALDGYQRTIDANRIANHDVILAIRVDGEILGLGGYGPAMVVWPRETDTALADMDDADWVWGVFAIESFTDDGDS